MGNWFSLVVLRGRGRSLLCGIWGESDTECRQKHSRNCGDHPTFRRLYYLGWYPLWTCLVCSGFAEDRLTLSSQAYREYGAHMASPGPTSFRKNSVASTSLPPCLMQIAKLHSLAFAIGDRVVVPSLPLAPLLRIGATKTDKWSPIPLPRFVPTHWMRFYTIMPRN